jgi:tetratricopeptide (TPR) repeat protein
LHPPRVSTTLAWVGGRELESTDAAEDERELGDTIARVGRYVMLERVGSGGVGIVFAAWDPVLSRRVALKLLRRHGAEDGANRLVREAQAMARLSHPNVVQVFDAGIVDGTAFVAMDFVEGGTLRAWLLDHHDRDDVLDLFLQAARGLAAAHTASLVHRDFKPDNVLLGRLPDGRVRAMVADFGLVRVGVETLDSEPVEIDSDGDPRLTTTGMIMGTPAYMAPEQFFGQVVDARSDQFSFCVALFEALYGERPFAGNNARALGLAVMHGDRAPIPPGRGVPAAIARVVERGLATDPAERHESMDAIVDALKRARAGRRVGVLAGVIAVPLVVGAAWVLVPEDEIVATPCADIDAPVHDAWTDRDRAAVEAAFASTELAYADEAALATVRSLDAWADAWIDARRDACEATAVRNEQSPELLDRRMVCLDRGLVGFSTAVEIVRAADRAVVERATSLASNLPDLRPCSDTAALLAPIPAPDPALQTIVDDLRTRADRARAQSKLGRSAEACRALGELAKQAAGVEYVPMQAEIELARGSCEMDASQPTARDTLEHAMLLAIEAHDGGTAADAARQIGFVVGYRNGLRDEGLRYTRLARALAADAITPRRDARIELAEAQIEFAASEFAAAREHIDRAREVGVPAFGEVSSWVSGLENTAGGIELRAGHYDAAQAAFERSLALAEQAHGEHHPDVALSLNNLALAFERQARYEDAIAILERSSEVLTGAYGADDARVGQVLHNLGGVYLLSGDAKTATGFLEQSIAVTTGAMGEHHLMSVGARTMLGEALFELGRLGEARPHLERALAIRERANGPDHPDMSLVLIAIARVDLAEGKLDAARTTIERALAIVEGREIDPGDRGGMLLTHAELLEAMGHRDEALARATEAERVLVDAGPTSARKLDQLRAWRDALQ